MGKIKFWLASFTSLLKKYWAIIMCKFLRFFVFCLILLVIVLTISEGLDKIASILSVTSFFKASWQPAIYLFIHHAELFFSLLLWGAWILIIIIFVCKIIGFFYEKLISNDHKNLIEDSIQLEKVKGLFNAKCKNHKALMITGEWGYGKTSFYKKSLKPHLHAEFKTN